MPKRQFYSKGSGGGGGGFKKYNKYSGSSSEKFRSDDPGLSREEEPEAKRPKTEKVAVDGTKKTDDEGNAYWEIGGKHRRVTVSDFKGNVLISVREYYEKDGQVLPGKKGISLSMEQYNNLLALAPQIEIAAKVKGAKEVARPTYADEVEKAKKASPPPPVDKPEPPKKKVLDSDDSEEESDEDEEADVDDVD